MTFLFFRAPPCRGEKKLGSGILPMPIVPVLRRSEVTTCFIHLYPEYPLVIQHSHGIDGPFVEGLPIKNGDFPWLC